MKFIQIKVGKSLNASTGEEWWKADATVSVGDDETAESVFDRVRNDIERWLPNPFKSSETNVQQAPNHNDKERETVDKRIGMIEAINACTSLDVLKTFALLSKSNPEHRAAYEKRFAELSE